MATASGITPIPNLFFTKKATQDPTTYGINIDAAITALAREGGKFVPMSWPGQFGTSMTALVGPGHIFDGTTLTEVGARTTGNFTSGSASVASVGNTTGITIGMVILAFTFAAVTFTANTTSGGGTLASPSSTSGLYIGMPIYGAGIPAGTTLTQITPSVTMSNNATATATGVTILATGLQPVVPVNTVVTAVTTSTITLSKNATATLNGAYIFCCQPLGTVTTGNTTNTSTTIGSIPSTRGMFVGMNITGSGIPALTTIASVVDDNTITISAAATATASSVTLTVTMPPPASNSRIDWITVHQATGRINLTMGTPSATPVPPSIPSGYLPVAQLLMSSAQTTIGTADLADARDFTGLGLPSSVYLTNSPAFAQTLAVNLGASL